MNPTIEIVDRGQGPLPVPPELHAYPACFVSAAAPFKAYRDRYRAGYVPFTFFFPPDSPEGIPTMPLIVPPTRFKLYDEFAHILDPLWDEAAKAIESADDLIIAGYSFPPTDERARKLLSATVSRRTRIMVVNPSPSSVLSALKDVGVDESMIDVVQGSFTEYLFDRRL